MKTWNNPFLSKNLIKQHLYGLLYGVFAEEERFYFSIFEAQAVQRVTFWRDFKSSTGFLSGPSLVQRSGTSCYVLLFSPFFLLTPWGSCVDLSECEALECLCALYPGWHHLLLIGISVVVCTQQPRTSRQSQVQRNWFPCLALPVWLHLDISPIFTCHSAAYHPCSILYGYLVYCSQKVTVRVPEHWDMCCIIQTKNRSLCNL